MTTSDSMSSMRITPVSAPVREQVVMKLRAALQEGRFQPGDRISDREICDLTGASRTSVREAIRQLETEGLLFTVANKGTMVAGLDAKQASDLYRVRARLEGLAAQLFTEAADEESRMALKQGLSDLKAAYESDDKPKMLSAKKSFYAALLRGAGNETLTDTLGRLHARVHQFRAVSLSRAGRASESVSELEQMVAAIDSGDGAAAADVAERHVAAAHDAAVEVLSRLESP
jgi:GntR family transcriptional regulator, trigonelline degradation regulator